MRERERETKIKKRELEKDIGETCKRETRECLSGRLRLRTARRHLTISNFSPRTLISCFLCPAPSLSCVYFVERLTSDAYTSSSYSSRHTFTKVPYTQRTFKPE